MNSTQIRKYRKSFYAKKALGWAAVAILFSVFGSSAQVIADSTNADSTQATAAKKESPAKADTVSSAITTDSLSASSKSDTVSIAAPKDTATALPVPVPQEAVAQTRPESPVQRSFSLFNYDRIISIGGSGSYFHYSEKINTDEYSGDTMYGAPKSIESGMVWGVSLSGTFFSRENSLWFRPKIAGLVGLGMQYDGSTQGKPITNLAGKTVAVAFDPLQFPKNNYFLFTGADIGLAARRSPLPFAVYSGAEVAVWYRSLLDSRYSYTQDAQNSETYIWWTIPIGALITKPVSPDLVVGLDARFEWMFQGSMQVSFNSGAGDSTHAYPAVFLGKRASFRVEPFLEKKMRDDLAFRISTYLQVFNFGQSNSDFETITSLQNGDGNYRFFFEPTSRTYWVGINCSFEFLRKRGL